MSEWFEREEGEAPLGERWHESPANIFIAVFVGVVVILWLTL